MYVIKPTSKITNIAASSEKAGWPKESVENDFRKDPWAANVSADSTLTLTVGDGAEALGLAYMNSPTVRVVVSGGVWDETYTIDPFYPNLSVRYGPVVGVHTITLTFADPGTDEPYCGIVRCADIWDFPCPKLGLADGVMEHCVSDRYDSGALYYELIEAVRVIQGSVRMDRDPDLWRFLREMAATRGRLPMFWQISEESESDWAVFAELETMPRGSHGHSTKSTIDFSLIEAV